MPRRFWTVPELAAFAAAYPHTRTSTLAARFGRTASAVKNLAVKLGLHKSPHFISREARFQNGHRTWNKGRHWNPEGSRATQFKKGHRGARQRPVGAERRTRDGVEVKIAEPNVWLPKARVVWEQHFGPIPRGAIVRLSDGNHDNCAPENLRLVTRAEHVRLNWKPRRAQPVQAPRWLAPIRAAA